jgi:hypothetical protein
VSAPTTVVPRTSIEAGEIPADDGLGLLLDLFALEPHGEAPASWRRPAGRHRPGPRAWLQEWLRRAAHWGAGPQGAWRAW